MTEEKFQFQKIVWIKHMERIKLKCCLNEIILRTFGKNIKL